MLPVRKFHTGLVPLRGEIKQGLLCKGRGCHITIEERMMRISGRKQNEIVIYAKTRKTAQQALNLILSSLPLFTGEPTLWLDRFIAYNDSEPENLSEIEKIQISSQYHCTWGFLTACAIAAKASMNRKYAYAITKYAYSISQYSVHGVDLEPHRSPHLSISPFYCDHILFAHAIIAAYSIVEELGFNVPASSKKPSMIKGKWNPIIKSKLEKKLMSAGINLEDKLLWTLRGPMRKVEKKKKPQVLVKASWAQGQVHDADLEVIDAINYASWLRSHVSSHKTCDLISSLSPYDVINVQHLARRLILESLGFWRVDGYYQNDFLSANNLEQ